MKETKTDQLKQIRDDVWNLKSSPLYSYRKEHKYFPVLGEGKHDARMMFIGEAPGKNEAETGRPFCGAAGRILDELLSSVELDRADVYITNIVKDRPPENRDPTPSEIKLYFPFLDRQIDVIKPEVIVTLGRFSMQFLLEKFHLPEVSQSISKLHGTRLQIQTSYGNAFLLPLYHPAVALYNSNTKKILQEDFQKLKLFVDK